MSFCTNCGAQLAEGAKFCTECGHKVEAPAEQNQANPLYGSSPVSPVQAPCKNSGSLPSPATDTTCPKASGKSRMIGLAVIIVLLLLAAGMVLLGGSKSDDPNLGRYEGVSRVVLGMELGTEEEWIELKAGGKAQIRLMGEEYSGKWTLEGEEFTLTQHGDKFPGTLKDGVLTVDFSGMLYTFAREDAVLPSPVTERASPVPESAVPVPPSGAAQSPYEWWADTWYGWAVVSDAGGDFTRDIDMAIDVIAEISLNADDKGHLEINDIYGYPICDVDLSLSGSTEYGILTCGEGSLWYFFETEPEEYPVSAGDWIIDPDQSMVSEFDHMICISDTIYSPENGWFDYYIFLRPWGMDWEDVRTADTSEMLYADMLPLHYDDWYLPQISGAVSESAGLGG